MAGELLDDKDVGAIFPRVIAVASRRIFDAPVRIGVPWDIPANNRIPWAASGKVSTLVKSNL